MSRVKKTEVDEVKAEIFYAPTMNLRFKAGRLEQLCLASQEGSPSWTEWREVDQAEDDAPASGE